MPYDAVYKNIEKLKEYRLNNDLANIRGLFANDSTRFENFSREHNGLLLDFSKTPIDQVALDILLEIARSMNVEARRDAMFKGHKINVTEDRAVLHTALRSLQLGDKFVNSEDVYQSIDASLEKMKSFCDAISSGNYLGYNGKKIKNIVNIGIGGSDLGPRMVVRALSPYSEYINSYFVANIDSADIADCLINLDPDTTLFIVTSKTFTTLETLANANYARTWLSNRIGEKAVSKHFVAVTSAVDKAIEFGIDEDSCFEFWDWVGGRFSLWSAVGLSILLSIGYDNFCQMLEGAAEMDEHFMKAPLEENLPVLFGLINYYYRVFCDYSSLAVVPYEHRLELLPSYLQQLFMESNGKSVSVEGKKINYSTGALIWGAEGTNSQHAFFQFLHQGSDIIPVEFIAFAKGHENCCLAKEQHLLLLANCVAQSEALLEGKTETDEPFKHLPGNRPSVSLLCDQLTPKRLGSLLALYEHRTAVEGFLFNINSFDQWGVELGKKLANSIYDSIRGKEDRLNSSYNAKLFDFFRKFNTEI